MAPHPLLPSCCAPLLAMACTNPAPQPDMTGEHERTMVTGSSDQALRYLLRVPAADAAPEDGWPLVLFLHGAGERGMDLDLVRTHGPPKHLEEIPELSACVFVAPQCPAEAWWDSASLKALLGEVLGLTRVDKSRLYVTGLSMGGYGTFGLLASYPDLFAAAVPVCGGGEIGELFPELTTGFRLEDLLRARGVPIRAFHGADDNIIPVEESGKLVRALQAAGGNAELTVYPGVGHDSWTRTYADHGLYRWLFQQQRASQ